MLKIEVNRLIFDISMALRAVVGSLDNKMSDNEVGDNEFQRLKARSWKFQTGMQGEK